MGSPSAELARSEGALVGCRETTRKGTGTGPGAMRSRELKGKGSKDTPRRGGAVGTGWRAVGL